MKTLLTILVPLFLAFTVQAQWQEVLDLPADYYSDIEFKNDSVGIIKLRTKFLYTQDGGDSWDSIATPTRPYYYDWLDDSTIYCHRNDKLFKTFDLGKTWDSIPLNNEIGFIEFTSHDTGYGYTASAYTKTVDGGITWVVKLDLPSAGTHTDFVFVSPEVGFSAGYYVIAVDRTTDAGETWELSKYVGALDLFFVDEQVGYFTSIAGEIHKTLDGGDTWVDVSLPKEVGSVESIFCKNALACICAGTGGYIGVTNDGGQTWVEESAGTTDNFYYTGCSSKYCFLSTTEKLYRRENTLGIAENNAQEVLFNLQPNPVKESFSLQLAEPMPIQTVEVYSTAGSLVKQFSGAHDVYVVKDLPAGTYLLEVTTTSGRGVKQFIKE